jgi:hypothetical protein
MFFATSDLYAQDHILDWKVLSNKELNCSRIISINLFIDKDNNSFVLANSGKDFLCINNNWIGLDEYGWFLNGFVKDGYFHLAFEKDEDVVIYNIRKDIKLANRIKLRTRHRRNKVIPASGQNGSYCFLSRRVKPPVNPINFVGSVLSGHGFLYEKPVLVEIQDDEMLQRQKIRYGGKIDESYFIKEVATGKDSIHFLGFRTPDERKSGGPKLAQNSLVILHYADYNFKKKKTTRKHSIYENIPKLDKIKNVKSYYGPLSIDNLDDDIFVVFSWVERQYWRQKSAKEFNIKDFISDIYYWQAGYGSFGDIEKIASGFLPLVRVDFFGNVHVIWLSSDGGLVHKVKRNGGWSEKKNILNNVDIYQDITWGITATTTYRKISAEFDKDNNLNVIFPTDGNLVHAKVKLSFLLDEQY